MKRNFLSRKYLDCHVQTNSDRINLNSVFSAPKAPLFCLKSIPLTGNELAGDRVENFEKLSVDNKRSLTSLVILYQLALKFFYNNVRQRCIPSFSKLYRELWYILLK